MELLTEAEAQRAIRLQGSLSADQTEILRLMVEAVPVVLEREIGPLVTGMRTWTTRVAGSGPLRLPWPARSVAVKVDGVTVDSAALDLVGLRLGALTAAVGHAPWYAGQLVEVTAAVGGTPSAAVKLAAVTLVRYWWRDAQQRPADGTGWQPPMGIPDGVRALLPPTHGFG